jgi:hypothetical protein
MAINHRMLPDARLISKDVTLFIHRSIAGTHYQKSKDGQTSQVCRNLRFDDGLIVANITWHLPWLHAVNNGLKLIRSLGSV